MPSITPAVRTLAISWVASSASRAATRAVGRGTARAVQATGRVVPAPIRIGAFFAGAGAMHFVRPDFFEAIVPDWFPSRRLANVTSGAAEIVLGVLTIPRATRRPALWGLAALTVAVFPANVDMAINDVEVRQEDGRFVRSVGTADAGGRATNWIRLPLQLPLLWWTIREARRA